MQHLTSNSMGYEKEDFKFNIMIDKNHEDIEKVKQILKSISETDKNIIGVKIDTTKSLESIAIELWPVVIGLLIDKYSDDAVKTVKKIVKRLLRRKENNEEGTDTKRKAQISVKSYNLIVDADITEEALEKEFEEFRILLFEN